MSGRKSATDLFFVILHPRQTMSLECFRHTVLALTTGLVVYFSWHWGRNERPFVFLLQKLLTLSFNFFLKHDELLKFSRKQVDNTDNCAELDGDVSSCFTRMSHQLIESKNDSNDD